MAARFSDRRSALIVAVAVAVAVLGGIAVAASSQHRTDPLWPAWAVLAVSLCAAAAAVCIYGARRWSELSNLWSIRAADATRPTLAIVGCALLGIAGGELASQHPWAAWRGDVLVCVSLLGGSTAGATMFGVRSVVCGFAKPDAASGTGDVDVAVAWQNTVGLIELRRLLQRLAAALGSIVALSTVALGISTLFSNTTPRESVLVFGAAGSLIVGLFYVPAAAAMRQRGEQLAQAIYSVEGMSNTHDLVARLEERSRLEHLVGVDRTTLEDLQAAIPILGPLLAAAALVAAR